MVSGRNKGEAKLLNRAELLNSNPVYKALRASFLKDGKSGLWQEWEEKLSEIIFSGNVDPDTYRKHFLGFLSSKTTDAQTKARFENLKNASEFTFQKTFSEDEKDFNKVTNRKQFGLDITDRKVRLLYDAGKVLMLAQAVEEQAALKKDLISSEIQAALVDKKPEVTQFDFKAAHERIVPGLTVDLNLEIKKFLDGQGSQIQKKNIDFQKIQALLKSAQEKLKDNNLSVSSLADTKALVAQYTQELKNLQKEVDSLIASIRPENLGNTLKNQKIGYFTENEIRGQIAKVEAQHENYKKQVNDLNSFLASKNLRKNRYKHLKKWTSQSKKIQEDASRIVDQQGRTFGGLPSHWAALKVEISAFKPQIIDELLSEGEERQVNDKINSYMNAQKILKLNAAGWKEELGRTVPIEFEVIYAADRNRKLRDEKSGNPDKVVTIRISEINEIIPIASKLREDISEQVTQAAVLTAEYNARLTQHLRHAAEEKAIQDQQNRDAQFAKSLEANLPPPKPQAPIAPPLEPISPTTRFREIPKDGYQPQASPQPEKTNGGAGPMGGSEDQQSSSSPHTPYSPSGSSISSEVSGPPTPSNSPDNKSPRVHSRVLSPQLSPHSPQKVTKKEGGAGDLFASAWRNTHWAVKTLSTVFTGGLLGIFLWLPAGLCHLAKGGNDSSKKQPISPTAPSKRSPHLPVIHNGNGVGTAGMNKQMGANVEKLKKGTYDEKILKEAKEKLRNLVNDQPPKNPKYPKIKLNQGYVRVSGERFKTIKYPVLGNGYELAFSIEDGKIYAKKDDKVFQLPDIVLNALLEPLKADNGILPQVAFRFNPVPVVIDNHLAITTVKSANENNGPLAIRSDGQVYQLSKDDRPPVLIQGVNRNATIQGKLADIVALSSPYVASKPVNIANKHIDAKHSDPMRKAGSV